MNLQDGDDTLIESKEKKQAKAQAAEAAKAEAEFQAKFAAKQEKKKVEKTIAEVDKSLQVLMQKAADSKAKGYGDVYRQCVGMIKIAKGRKMQAEKFLFQMEAMQEIQNISKSSAGLLDSMSTIMNSLGKLSIDPAAMQNTQRSFLKAQSELDKQSATIDGFVEGMTMSMPDDDELGNNFSDADIDAEIDSMILSGQISNATVAPSAKSDSNDLSDLKKLAQL